MSSPAGFPYPQADFLARWMPSSSRAGVILTPCPDLTGSPFRNPLATAPNPEAGDPDSFASDFGPLLASADSSCVFVDGPSEPAEGGRPAGERHLNGGCSLPPGLADGEMDSVDEMASDPPDLPLVMKLDQLRKWQQHMQEQLKAHQLEELLRLQEEHQKLLGMMNGSQHHSADEENVRMSGAALVENTPSRVSDLERSYCPTVNYHGGPKGSDCGSQGGQEWLHIGHNQDELHDEEEGSWVSDPDQEEITDDHEYQAPSTPSHCAAPTGESCQKEDSDLQDRPIKPGISGQKQTFEELLEEQLKLEEQRLRSAVTEQGQNEAEVLHLPPKRAFLRRGEGLKRFSGNHIASVRKEQPKKDPKPQPQARVMSRSNSAPAAILKSAANAMQRPPVQRKTAVLNKENRLRGPVSPPQDARGESKAVRTKILGSHQRQNTDGAETVQTPKQSQLGQVKEQTSRKAGPSLQTTSRPSHNVQLKSVDRQVGMSEAPSKAGDDVAIRKSCRPREELPTQSQGRGGETDGPPRDSFEFSFQERLRRWECDHQLENMELGEFELLEQAAEELSFSSNSSFVLKVLQMDQQQCKAQAANSLHQRRLSSTPIKSPPRGDSQRCGSGEPPCKNTLVNSKTRDNMLHRDAEEGHGGSQCATSPDYIPEEHKEVVVNPPPSAVCFPAPSNPPYDKRTYQEEDSCGDSASEGTRGEDRELDSNLDDSTVTEDTDSQQRGVVFDDDDTWNDAEDTTVCASSDGGGLNLVSREMTEAPSPQEPAALRVAGVTGSSAGQKPGPPPPPASQLMTKLFPSLKPKSQNAPLPAVSSTASEPSKAEETAQQVQSRQLRERLAELELEIERFKRENAALAKLRQDNERNQDQLRKERLELERTKAEEMAKFEEYKKEENRKLLKERKLFEKHASAARAIPDKKEREEIQALKEQLSSVQEEMKKKESRWSATHCRLRKQIDNLSQENNSLRDEVRMLEKLRLSALKKNSIPLDTDKDKDGKDAASVTKGVKFASPLDSRGTSNSSRSSSPPHGGSAAASRVGFRDSSHPAIGGIKSSLRRSSGPPLLCSSFSTPGRRTEEKPGPARMSSDKVPIQEHPQNSCDSSSPLLQKRDNQPNEAECKEAKEPEAAQEVITHTDGKIEKLLSSGDRLIVFPNGTRKEVSADGLTVKVTFFNGDTKQISADQRVIYYYANAQTTHITYPDGMEVLHFRNNQTEKHFPDGRKEITFPDQTVKTLFPNGSEESVLTDGTIIYVSPDGIKEIHFNTGQKEIHTPDYKRREYPDGTVKTVYTDGRQETRYPTGRLRIKDKDGNVIMDDGV